MTDKTKKYAHHYKILEDINKKLHDEQDSPAIIDDLADLLETASKSFRACKERISAAEKFLNEFEKKTESDE